MLSTTIRGELTHGEFFPPFFFFVFCNVDSGQIAQSTQDTGKQPNSGADHFPPGCLPSACGHQGLRFCPLTTVLEPKMPPATLSARLRLVVCDISVY